MRRRPNDVNLGDNSDDYMVKMMIKNPSGRPLFF